MTARTTSPFLILELGRASLTETTMTSPRVAYFRRVPPRTLIQPNFLAPELSATSRIVRIWIIYRLLHRPMSRWQEGPDRNRSDLQLRGSLEDLLQTPPFISTQRAGFNQQHLVSDMTLFLLIVSLHPLVLPYILLIDGMSHEALD